MFRPNNFISEKVRFCGWMIYFKIKAALEKNMSHLTRFGYPSHLNQQYSEGEESEGQSEGEESEGEESEPTYMPAPAPMPSMGTMAPSSSMYSAMMAARSSGLPSGSFASSMSSAPGLASSLSSLEGLRVPSSSSSSRYPAAAGVVEDSEGSEGGSDVESDGDEEYQSDDEEAEDDGREVRVQRPSYYS